MKLLAAIFAVVLAGCATTDDRVSYPPASKNLSEAEVRMLPSGTRFEDVARQLRYFTRSAIAIPIVAFAVEGEADAECRMSYDTESGRLRYAWMVRKGKEPVVIWPKSAAGQDLSEIIDLFVGEKQANQPPQTTPLARRV